METTMRQNITTNYILSGDADKRMETIGHRQQQVQAWNKWCIAINPVRKADIITYIKAQNFELFCLLVDDPQKSQSFFDTMASNLQERIKETQKDVEAIEFEFEGHRIHLNNLAPPGTENEIEHYYWCSEF